MLKFILSSLFRHGNVHRFDVDPQLRALWLRDPLSHPALEAMTERELGDLPFRR